MKRVDTHAHMPSKRNVWGIEHFKADAYLDVMDKLGIDQSIILPLDGLFFDAPMCNTELAEWCATDSERLIPFFTFEPRDPGALKEIDRCINELGMRGVKLHPWLQGFRPTEDVMMPLCEKLASEGLPILFHDGTTPYSTPLQIGELARIFPTLKVVLGHGGLYDMADEAIATAQEFPNIWISMTSLPTWYMQKIIDNVSIDQLLFGSDGGLGNIDKQSYVGLRWQMFESLNLDAEMQTKILSTNPERLLRGSFK